MTFLSCDSGILETMTLQKMHCTCTGISIHILAKRSHHQLKFHLQPGAPCSLQMHWSLHGPIRRNVLDMIDRGIV